MTDLELTIIFPLFYIYMQTQIKQKCQHFYLPYSYILMLGSKDSLHFYHYQAASCFLFFVRFTINTINAVITNTADKS